MKKIQLLLILLIIMALLALMDYFVTQPDLRLPKASPSTTDSSKSTSSAPTQINQTKKILDAKPESSAYHLEKSVRTVNLFETFDLDQLNLISYKNSLLDSKEEPLTVYELQAPAGQGSAAFLKIKLMMTEKLSSETEINANNQYGENSLFYNNKAAPSTGFLLVQIGDTIFGFQYSKESQVAFQFIQNFIKAIPQS